MRRLGNVTGGPNAESEEEVRQEKVEEEETGEKEAGKA